MSICVQTCMFNFQSQVLVDQINFFKLKGNIVIIFQHNTSIYYCACIMESIFL